MATLIKTDIFKRLMYYAYEIERGRTNITAIHVDRVKEIKALNAQGEFPRELLSEQHVAEEELAAQTSEFEDVTGFIELPEEKRRRRGKRRNTRGRGNSGSRNQQSSQRQSNRDSNQSQEKKDEKGGGETGNQQRSRRSRGGRHRPNKPDGQKSTDQKSSQSKTTNNDSKQD